MHECTGVVIKTKVNVFVFKFAVPFINCKTISIVGPLHAAKLTKNRNSNRVEISFRIVT